MLIFHALVRFVPRRVAVVLTAFVLTAAIIAIWWYWAEPSAPFRYFEV